MSKEGKQSYSEVADRSTSSLDTSPVETVRSLGEEISSAPHKKKSLAANTAKCLTVIVLLMIGSFYGWQVNAKAQLTADEQRIIRIGEADKKFSFEVYCPISYYPCLKNPDSCKEGIDDEDLRRLLYSGNDKIYKFGTYEFDPKSCGDLNASSIYIVQIISTKVNTIDEANVPRLLYCGLTRQWLGDCTKPSYSCSSPGPIFDFQTEETVDVIWINQLDGDLIPRDNSEQDDNSDCLHKANPRCALETKKKPKSTFLKPTDVGNHQQFKKVNITNRNWPASTHIHGLEIRPTFDGNPLSWVANTGEKGIGAMSLDYSCYYDNFDNSDINIDISRPPSYKFINETLNSISKINRYPNVQNPGNLWYHDHAMRLTQYNVAYGLSGVYIIRNSTMESNLNLPTKDKERFIMKNINGWFNSQNLVHEHDTVYRYRILNNDGRPNYLFYFSNQTCPSSSNPNRNVAEAQKQFKLPFLVIGADSSLLNETIPNITSVVLGAGERIEVLIEFDQSLSKVSICTVIFDPDVVSVPNQPSKLSAENKFFTLEIVPKRQDESSIDNKVEKLDLKKLKFLNVPFTNLSSIPDKDISRFRMRPLLVATYDFKFMINGHWDFHKGQSEDPEIGTVEDWYIINGINENHPIHVHLINFQVIEQQKLRYLFNGISGGFSSFCSFYELDFYLEAFKKSSNKTINRFTNRFLKSDKTIDYKALCTTIKNRTANFTYNNVTTNWTELFNNGVEQATYLVNVENSYDKNTRISGINVNQLINNDPNYSKQALSLSNCPENTKNKYVCGSANIKGQWNRRWKDTVLVPPLTVLRYRIRWTRSNYKAGEKDYFHVPVDQLREFPGFVYHCHILDHEDNEMMRSIMLQVPKNYVSTNKQSACQQANWSDKYKCLNQQCQIDSKNYRLLQE